MTWNDMNCILYLNYYSKVMIHSMIIMFNICLDIMSKTTVLLLSCSCQRQDIFDSKENVRSV